jgi:transcriptional regulator with XRE-family HTH domain
MEKAKAFAVLLGGRLRACREERGLTQDEVAARLWPLGLSFTRSIVNAVERGTRELTVPEIAAILAVLDADLSLLRDLGPVAMDRGISINSTTIVDALDQTSRSWLVRFGGAELVVRPSTGGVSGRADQSLLKAVTGAYSEAEVKAARKLGVSPQAIAKTAEALWGRSLTAERDARIAASGGGPRTARSLQAVRGHVTRALLEELEQKLRARRGKRGQGK